MLKFFGGNLQQYVCKLNTRLVQVQVECVLHPSNILAVVNCVISLSLSFLPENRFIFFPNLPLLLQDENLVGRPPEATKGDLSAGLCIIMVEVSFKFWSERLAYRTKCPLLTAFFSLSLCPGYFSPRRGYRRILKKKILVERKNWGTLPAPLGVDFLGFSLKKRKVLRIA